MVTKDDSRKTFEYDKHYIIYPHFDWWSSERFFTKGGKHIKDGFEYNSETNSEWLGEGELRQLISELE